MKDNFKMVMLIIKELYIIKMEWNIKEKFLKIKNMAMVLKIW